MYSYYLHAQLYYAWRNALFEIVKYCLYLKRYELKTKNKLFERLVYCFTNVYFMKISSTYLFRFRTYLRNWCLEKKNYIYVVLNSVKRCFHVCLVNEFGWIKVCVRIPLSRRRHIVMRVKTLRKHVRIRYYTRRYPLLKNSVVYTRAPWKGRRYSPH